MKGPAAGITALRAWPLPSTSTLRAGAALNLVACCIHQQSSATSGIRPLFAARSILSCSAAGPLWASRRATCPGSNDGCWHLLLSWGLRRWQLAWNHGGWVAIAARLFLGRHRGGPLRPCEAATPAGHSRCFYLPCRRSRRLGASAAPYQVSRARPDRGRSSHGGGG